MKLVTCQSSEPHVALATKARGWTRSSQGVDSLGDLEKRGNNNGCVEDGYPPGKLILVALPSNISYLIFDIFDGWKDEHILHRWDVHVSSFSGGYSSPLFGFVVAIQLSTDSITSHLLFPSNSFPSTYYCWRKKIPRNPENMHFPPRGSKNLPPGKLRDSGFMPLTVVKIIQVCPFLDSRDGFSPLAGIRSGNLSKQYRKC